MADRPILFSAPMVKALLAGRKSQTRRILKPPYGTLEWLGNGQWRPIYTKAFSGDRLWVREAFNAFQFSQDGDDAWPVKIPTLEECKEADELAYRYGAPQIVYRESDRARKWFADQKWRPAIHMPRWASRLTLTLTDVRVERLQDISEADAWSEGCQPGALNDRGEPFPADEPAPDGKGEIGWDCARDWYADLWDSLHGTDAWDANPWVAAYTFTVQRGNFDRPNRTASDARTDGTSGKEGSDRAD